MTDEPRLGRERMYSKDYDKVFRNKNYEARCQKALEKAEEIRRFEIELYWRRASYFWTVLTAIFAAYFIVIEISSVPQRYMYAGFLSSIGLVLSCCWYLVNRASKYWQENWENHIELLEDKIQGPLYKTTLERPGENKGKTNLDSVFLSPVSFSVSKINAFISLFITICWFILWFYAAARLYSFLFCGIYPSSAFFIMLFLPVILLIRGVSGACW